MSRRSDDRAPSLRARPQSWARPRRSGPERAFTGGPPGASGRGGAGMSDDEAPRQLSEGSGPIDDLALTLPVFLGYHLGVAFLPVRNAADLVTHELVQFAENSLIGYIALTVILGLGYAGVLLVL